jgi:phage head maturation protease
MLSMRTAKRMHSGESIGEVIHSMPLTNDVAKALGIQSDREGWIIAIRVNDEQVWKDVKSGKLSAFSIGGRAMKEMV